MKRCLDCEQSLPLTEFGVDKREPDGVRKYCRTCHAAYQQRWRKANPDARRKHQQDSVRRRIYNLTPEQYDALLEVQGGRCAICQADQPRGKGTWHVDHDHACGCVRGLLCSPCNTGIGHLADNADRLRQAAIYIDTHTASHNEQETA